MTSMICNVDDKTSVLSAMNNITKDWFNAANLYEELRANNKTESPNFWNIRDLLNPITDYLRLPLSEFLREWNHRCSLNSLKIMGYHCTRHTNKKVFYEQGILPLSEKIIESFFSIIISEFQIILTEQQKKESFEKIITNNIWKYRSGKGAGPYFFLSYKNAQNPNNDFHKNGPEIWWGCIDDFLQYCKDKKISVSYTRNKCREIIAEKLLPLIVHCAIPYTILPDKDYYTFCIFRAYFNFVDPDDDMRNLFEGYSIDLKGQALEPEHIIRIEEL